MGHRMGSSGRRMIAAVGLVAGLAGWWIASDVRVGQARTDTPLTRTTAMFGVAPGQIARVGIVNVAGESGIMVIGVRILDDHGKVIGESSGRRELGLGEAFFFDFAGDRVERAEVRAVLALLGRPTDFLASVQLSSDPNGGGATVHAERFLPELALHNYFGHNYFGHNYFGHNYFEIPGVPGGAGR